MMRALLLLLTLLSTGCLTAAQIAYESSTDERSVGTQAADAKIATVVRKRVTDIDTKALLALDVYCHQGLVVLTGVVPRGSTLGTQAVQAARTVDGVRRVETHFVQSQASKTSDFAISTKLKTRLVGDGQLKAAQVDWSVLDGYVVLVGVVDGNDKVQKILAHARAIDGVVGVKSFVQLKPATRP